MPALDMKEVRKLYGSGDTEVVALDHASLDVAGDEMVALVGPSGSGKTTLLSIAGGLLAPTAGTVRVGPHEISGYGRKQLTRFRPRRVRHHVLFPTSGMPDSYDAGRTAGVERTDGSTAKNVCPREISARNRGLSMMAKLASSAGHSSVRAR